MYIYYIYIYYIYIYIYIYKLSQSGFNRSTNFTIIHYYFTIICYSLFIIIHYFIISFTKHTSGEFSIKP